MTVALTYAQPVERSVHQRPRIKGTKRLPVHGKRMPGGIRPAKVPAESDDKDRPKDLEHFPRERLDIDVQELPLFLKHTLKERVRKHENCVIKAVNDIFPARAVPDADDHEDDERGDAGRQYFAVVAAKLLARLLLKFCEPPGKRDGIKDVILHPLPQGHVPSLPEFRVRPREERLSEVLRHRDVQDLRHTDDDVHASGKVRIDLNAIVEHAHENDKARVLPVIVKHLGDHDADPLGDDDLLKEAPQNAQKPLAEAGVIPLVLSGELPRQLVVAADRALDHLREIADEQEELEEILICPVLSPADIDQISHALKCVKRNAQRQQQIRHGHLLGADSAQHVIDILDGEPAVLEHCQNTEIQ